MNKYEVAKKIIGDNHLKTNIGKIPISSGLRGRYNQGLDKALELIKPLLK